MNMIAVDYLGKVALVKLCRGVTNALNQETVDELTETLQILRTDSDVHGLVLCSSNEKFFSIGFDIPELFDLNREDFEWFYQAFNRFCMDLYTLPKPTIGAITGHAIAGGCILALCCDYRFIADGRKLMGLNEIKLGVPVPYLADCILRQLVGVRYSREIMDSGEFYLPDRALQMGLVDEALPLEQVLARSIEKVESLGIVPAAAFDLIKRNRVRGIAAQVSVNQEKQEKSFIERWYSDEARELLKVAMERF